MLIVNKEVKYKCVIEHFRLVAAAAIVALSAFLINTLTAQTSTTVTFGQNRVQYKDFIFSYYESDNFTTYFYQGGQDVAKFVVKAAEDDAEELGKTFDYHN